MQESQGDAAVDGLDSMLGVGTGALHRTQTPSVQLLLLLVSILYTPWPLKVCLPLSTTSNAPMAGRHTAAATPFL
jgi:hypothetical protein